MKNLLIFCLVFALMPRIAFAQHSDENGRLKQLNLYQDTLINLGNTFINSETDLVRKNANYAFIKVLVSALKMPNSFLYGFDSVKSINVINSPDNRFRIFCWHILNNDGSYRFYGTVQMNTGGKLKMYPLEDYSPLTKNPEDTVTDNRGWYGAQYYKIIPVYAQPKPYYLLVGWKGYTAESTKKVIDVLSFEGDKIQFGKRVFDGNGKGRERVIFEYNRGVSMLLKYVPDQNLIVFDHLAPPDPKLKNDKKSYGPDLTYSGYKLKNGRWVYIDEIDMRNVPQSSDDEYVDPKKQAAIDRASAKKNQ